MKQVKNSRNKKCCACNKRLDSVLQCTASGVKTLDRTRTFFNKQGVQLNDLICLSCRLKVSNSSLVGQSTVKNVMPSSANLTGCNVGHSDQDSDGCTFDRANSSEPNSTISTSNSDSDTVSSTSDHLYESSNKSSNQFSLASSSTCHSG